jgi:hypothetical protein
MAAADEHDLADRLVREGAAAISAGLREQRAGRRLDDDAIAWLSLLVSWAEVRDLAMACLGETRPDTLHSRALWLEVLRRAEPDLVPAAGVLFALVAWRRGEMVLAHLAVRRVLEIDPDHPLARAIDNAFRFGLSSEDDVKSSTMDRRSTRVRRARARRPRTRSSWRRAGSPPA